MLKYLFQDLPRNRGNPKFICILAFFRFVHFFAKKKQSICWYLGIPFMIVYRILVEDFLCIELRASTKVGIGLKIDHGFALVINSHAVIGNNVHLRHSTTIGCKMNGDGSQGSSPVIGNNVEVGANVVILGDISIGDNSKIAAGSVVISDVTPNSIVAGNPAKVIRQIM
ncbi:serine acetyltransferase [Reichenbachiella sp. MALMAid0571]|uniref:serine acetyltransferase n=1 Tax=Reichenbachiella sp. MALMAid0571 TaxID=3143939 RepID=UPI0032DF7F23